MIDLKTYFKMGSIFIETKAELHSPILIGNPHAGNIVPRELYIDDKPLGLDKAILNTHEALDPHVNNIVNALNIGSSVSSYLSRLVVDNDRVHDRIPRELCDGTLIPANHEIPTEQKDWRIAQYKLYHETKRQLAQDIIKKFGYCQSYDIHTFEPVFQGQRRDVEIGTFKFHRTKFTDFIEESLAERLEGYFNFKPDAPYDVRENGTMPECARRNASEKNAEFLGIPIIGIEINQTVAQDLETATLFTEIFKEVIKDAEQHFHPSTKNDPYHKTNNAYHAVT